MYKTWDVGGVPVFVQNKIVHVGNYHIFLSDLLNLKVIFLTLTAVVQKETFLTLCHL